MKKLFPFFKQYHYLHYFDSAATTLKPQLVIDAITEAYSRYTIPIEKSFYKEAENSYEEVITPLKLFLEQLFNAKRYQIFFGHSVTSLLHLILDLCIRVIVNQNENISVLMPETVHNSFFNGLKKYKNICFYYYNNININDFLNNYKFDIIYLPTIDHITGEECNYVDLVEYKKNNRVVIIGDASQSGMYQSEDLSSFLFDFFVLGSHKMYGPEGLGIVMVSKLFLDRYQDSILDLNTYFLRNFFGQGSLPYTAFYGFAQALKFLKANIYNNYSYQNIQFEFIKNIYKTVIQNKNLVCLSSQNTKTIITFYHKNKHSHDLAIQLSRYNICVRSGDLCSKFQFKNNIGLVRLSLGCYIDKNDVDTVTEVLSLI